MTEHKDCGDALYSRSGVTNPFGKCTEELKIPLDEITKEAFVAMAVMNDMRPAEFGRYVLHCYLFGHATMLKHHAKG